MKKQLLFSSIIAITLYSCGSTPEPTKSNDLDNVASVEVIKNQQNKPLVDGYMEIKNALVISDAPETQKQAQAFISLLKKNIANSSIPANENTHALQTAGNDIALSNDIKTQRESFIAFNTAFENYIIATGTSANLYKQHCPMFGENGGTWLSTETEINNPYFGNQMLHCGSIQQQIVLK